MGDIRLLSFLMVILPICSSAYTTIDEEITGHVILTQDKSPYVASKDVNITGGAILEVGEGVEVRMAPGRGVHVYGNLIIRGSSQSRVTLTLWSEFVPEYTPPQSNEIRLSQVTQDGTGLLETRMGDAWSTVCDYQMSDLNRNKVWMENMAKVACRELGFAENEDSVLMLQPESKYTYIRSNSYRCTGEESRLSNCTVLTSYCYYNQYRIGVQCNSVRFGNHWSGITFYDTSTPGSQLSNVDILHAGMSLQEDRPTLTHAIYTRDNMNISVSDVNIIDSAGHGIMMSEMNSTFILRNIRVKDCQKDGIHISTLDETGLLSNIHAEGNKNGIVASREDVLDFSGEDFCSITCIRCQHRTEDFPLRFEWTQGEGQNVDCTKTFSTEVGNVVYLRPISASYNVHLTITDGSHIDSPIVYQAQLAQGQLAQPLPTLVTQSTSITIKIRGTYYRYKEHFHFELLSGLKDEFGIHLNDINVTNNDLTGVVLSSIRMPVILTNVASSNNSVGLHLHNTASLMQITDMESFRERAAGVWMDDAEGMVTMTRINLHDNMQDGIRHNYMKSCDAKSINDRFATVLNIQHSSFRNNENHNIYLYSSCRMNVTFANNSFVDKTGIKSIFNYNNGGQISHLRLVENTFTGLSETAVSITGYSSCSIELSGNTFQANSYRCVNVDIQISYYSRSFYFYMSDNIFVNNESPVSLVSVVVPKANQNSEREYIVRDNRFEDNSVQSPDPYIKNTLQDLSAVLHMTTNFPCVVTGNIFNNPNSSLQFSVADVNSLLTHDATLNFWGSTDLNQIDDGIYAYNQQYILAKVKYNPYYTTPDRDQNDISSGDPDFVQGETIGGILRSTVTLTDSTRPYRVTKDINVMPQGSLRIGPGVELQFESGLGILSSGQLLFEGSSNNVIALTARQGVSEHVRLIRGETEGEGFPQIYYNNTWHSFCYFSLNTESNNFLCTAAGYGSYKKFTHKRDALNPPRVRSIACGTRYELCTVDEDTSSCNANNLYLTCNERYWSGIHLSVDAKSSLLKHVTLDHFGEGTKAEKAGLLIDYLDHDINNVKLTEPLNQADVIGIVIKRSNAISRPIMSDINIVKYAGHGIISYDARFGLKGTNISSTNGGSYGVYLQSQLSTISTLRDDIQSKMCSTPSELHLTGDPIYLNVLDTVINLQATCAIYFKTDPGKRIAIQLLLGSIPDCALNTISFYDGHKNFSKAEKIYAANDGMIWSSTGADAYFLMSRTHHYRYACVNLVFRIWAFAGDLDGNATFMISTSSFTNFHRGVSLKLVHIPTYISNSYFKKNYYYGIYANQGKGRMELASNTFDSIRDAGLRIDYHRGEVFIDNSTFIDNPEKGIYINYGLNEQETCVYIISRCEFYKNKYSVSSSRYGNRYSQQMHNTTISIEDSIFELNEEVIHVYFYSDNPNGIIKHRFLNNIVKRCQRGIVSDASKNAQLYEWDITSNQFEDGGSVMSLRGHGEVRNNSVRNCSSIAGALVDIQHYSTKCATNFIGNIIKNNLPTNDLVNIDSRCKDLVVKDNTISHNIIRRRAIILNSRVDDELRGNSIFEGNILSENVPVDTCMDSAAFEITGFRKVIVSQNIFSNPELVYEAICTQRTRNGTSTLDMSFNFWGTTNLLKLSERIQDGYKRIWTPRADIVPYYTSQDLTLTDTIHPEYSFIKSDGTIGGLVEESITLNGEYQVSSDLQIPDGVTLTIAAGSRLVLHPSVGIYVDGSLNTLGTTSDPVVVTSAVSSDAITGAICVGLSARLVGGSSQYEGRLEINENGIWTTVCNRDWHLEDANVACRQLGFGPATTKDIRFGWSGSPSRHIFQCHGDETSLHQCSYYIRPGKCYSYNPIGIRCSALGTNMGVFITSRDNQQISKLQGLVLDTIHSVQVTGTPPILQNVEMKKSRQGFIYVGAGIAKEVDVYMKDVTITESLLSAVSMYDITSNVTLDRVTIDNAWGNGFHLSPTVDGSTVLPDVRLIASTFRFCDLETSIHVIPGEEYKFFSAGAQALYGCRRVFMTDPGHSIVIFMKAFTTANAWVLTAEFFEGYGVDTNNRINQFSVIREDRGSQTMELQSWDNVLTVVIVEKETFITYASVQSVPRRANDCSFEDGTCGWHEYDHLLSLHWGNWTVYRTADEEENKFKGMTYDVTFPSGKEGHYIFTGDSSGTDCSRYTAYSASAIEAILEGPELLRSNNLCSVTFYHYRSINYAYRGDLLRLYINDGKKLTLVWSSSAYNTYTQWLPATVSLHRANMTSFRLLFHVKYMSGCRNSVGIDDIKFHQCPIEKLVSTISLTDVRLQNIQLSPISVWNRDPTKHNIIWIERISISDSLGDIDDLYPMIGLNLKSAYVLIRNTDMSHVNGRAVDIVFDSETDTRTAEATIVQNKMWYVRRGGAIKVYNKGDIDAIIRVSGNDIRHNSALDEYSIIQIVNISLIMDSNIMYNNSGKYIVQLGSQQLNIGNALPQVIYNNIIWLNSAQMPSARYTVLTNTNDLEFHENILNNPGNTYELSASPNIQTPNSLNCSHNWWSSGISQVVKSKIRGSHNTIGLPPVVYDPFWTYIPKQFGLSDSCPVGWSRQGSRCMLYNGGAVIFTEAIKYCENLGATLLSENLLKYSLQYIFSKTKYRDVDGTMKNSLIWINKPTNIGKINSFNIPANIPTSGTCQVFDSDGSVMPSECDILRPYICEKFSVVSCKNSCFQNGVCLGTKCLCNQGWSGEDCSTSHCSDVNDCSQRGTCDGPNQCKCKAGWLGRACTLSHCSRFASCGLCTYQTGCGWCDTTQRCVPGTGYGADEEVCPVWFYYTCLTMESTQGCSPQIGVINCEEQYCDADVPYTNVGVCQECEDVKNCYSDDQPPDVSCPIWDERKCPKGSIIANYSDPSRVDNTVLDDNIIIVDPAETLIYFCPVLLSNDTNDNQNMYIVRKNHGWKVGQLLTSAQAGGVFTKLQNVVPLEKGLVMLIGGPASITDAVKYADFKDESVPFQRIDDKMTRDQIPPSHLLDMFYNDTLYTADTVLIHTLPEENVYKCVGHEYEDGNGTNVYSYTVVVPATDETRLYAVGDVVVSNYSEGFLETVDNTTKTRFGTFAFTHLAQYSENVNLNIKMKTEQVYGDMTGEAGDNWPGLVFYEDDNRFSAQIGDTIVGRRASGVFGEVIRVQEEYGFIFVEIIAVETMDRGYPVTIADTSNLHKIRRRKRATVTLSESGSKSLSWDSGVGVSISTKASYSASLRLTMKVEWDWFDSYLEEAGWTLDGTISDSITVSYYAEAKYSKSGSIADYNGPDLAKFFIYLIPGRVFFEMGVGYEVTASAKATIKATQTSTNKITVGSRYTRTSGIRNSPPRKSSSESKSVTGKLEGSLSAAIKITPQMRVQWPLWYSSKDKARGRRGSGDDDLSLSKEDKDGLDFIPGSLKTEAEIKACIEAGGGKKCVGGKVTGEGNVRDELTSLEVAFRLPISLSVSAKACDPSCKNPDSLTSLNACAKIDSFQVAFAALAWEYVVSLNLGAGPCKQKCSDNLAPCCLCEDDNGQLVPGSLDPKTEECLCPCFCDPPDNTVKSVKKKGEECMCEECPDGTLERYYQDVKCPCICPDKPDKEIEMDESGNCPCECECEDGSKDKPSEDGTCPCKCECKNCEESTLGPDGCKCPNDLCPECKNGAKAEWKDCKCECPDEPCGKSPACANGRTGPGCKQPHCPNCQGCSGNGECTTSSSSCASSCRCNPQWMGPCCERRRPRRRSGDPHLETADGVEFDYFGIGQIWDCYSESNDFGYQVRFYYYGRTSFTGAVAMKAGDSVVTVTTPNPAVESDMPILRIDGAEYDITKDWNSFFGNASVKLDINHNTEKGDDTGVVIIALQYDSGASLSLDIRFSPKMKRQYINIQYVLTKAFVKETRGLCGYMDDNMKNDLLASDGFVYNISESSKFVNSWRIEPMVREGAGVSGSWSWTKSNFHPDDKLDISYTDPNFTPIYSLEGFSQSQIYTATMLCSSLGLTGTLRDGCIYDVVITDDTTLTSQEVLKTGCPNQCSGKGRCVNSTCQCATGWSGEECNIGACGSCYHGQCVSGFCQCNIGWEGVECSQKATCYNVNNCTDSDHGQCQTTDQCLCVDGFIGDDCSIVPTCFNRNNCSDNGVCVDYDKCKCNLGYQGEDCTQFSCEILGGCSGHGMCVALDVCLCLGGWEGLGCETPDCSTVNDCSGFGVCESPATCSCIEGYFGSDCSLKKECPEVDNCNSQGVCVANTIPSGNGTVLKMSCKCDFGFSGNNCTDVTCDGVADCNNHGQCIEPNLCLCDSGYTGADCSLFSCETKVRCSGQGNCTGYESCSCESGWSGESCEVAACDAVNQCSAQGFCIAPNTCQCYDGFQGKICDEKLGENMFHPVLNITEFHVILKENQPVGTILTVVASDQDEGLNGEIRYSLDLTEAQYDLSDYLVIDSVEGTVTLIRSIPRTVVTSGEVSFRVLASDQGLISKITSATVNLTIVDINDHCPEFSYPKSDAEIYLNASGSVGTLLTTVLASDRDFDKNGDITFKLALTSSLSEQSVRLDEDGNMYSATSPLPLGKQKIHVIATDGGDSPCSSEIRFYFVIYPSNINLPTTTVAPTTSRSTPTTQSEPPSTQSTTPSTMLPATEEHISTTESVQVSPETNTPVDNNNQITTATDTSAFLTSQSEMAFTSKSPPEGVPTPSLRQDVNTSVIIMGVVLAVVAVLAVIIIAVLVYNLHKMKTRMKYKEENIQMPKRSE